MDFKPTAAFFLSLPGNDSLRNVSTFPAICVYTVYAHTHARTHAHTDTHTHTCMHARTHTLAEAQEPFLKASFLSNISHKQATVTQTFHTNHHEQINKSHPTAIALRDHQWQSRTLRLRSWAEPDFCEKWEVRSQAYNTWVCSAATVVAVQSDCSNSCHMITPP